MVRPIEYRKYNQIKFYYGIVVDVDEQFNIHFRIPDIIDNLDTYPIAHPITKHTSQIFKNDNVLIMQLDVDLQEFVYFPNEVTTWTGIRYKNCIIELAPDADPDDASKGDIINIEVVKLKDAEDDDHEAEDPEKIKNRIQVTDKGISVMNFGDNGDWIDYKGDGSEEPQEGKFTGFEITKNSITFLTTDKAKQEIDGDSQTITLNAGTDTTKLTLNGSSTSGFELTDSKNTITGDSTQGIDIKDVNQNEIKTASTGITISDVLTNKIETAGQGIKESSLLQSKLSLSALVGLDNAAGGLSSMISDIWTEMLTLATNLVALASACAAIQYIGPGALTNGTAAAVGAASSSLGTIAAKMAMSKAISGPAT